MFLDDPKYIASIWDPSYSILKLNWIIWDLGTEHFCWDVFGIPTWRSPNIFPVGIPTILSWIPTKSVGILEQNISVGMYLGSQLDDPKHIVYSWDPNYFIMNRRTEHFSWDVFGIPTWRSQTYFQLGSQLFYLESQLNQLGSCNRIFQLEYIWDPNSTIPNSMENERNRSWFAMNNVNRMS